MTDKIQEIKQAIFEFYTIGLNEHIRKVSNYAPEWLSYLLTELDAVKADKERIYEYSIKKQNEYFDMLDNLSKLAADRHDKWQLTMMELDTAKQENERLKEDYDSLDAAFNALDKESTMDCEKLKIVQQQLKQAIDPLKEAHRLLELNRTAEAYATLTAAMNTVVEQVGKENTHEK